MRDEDFIKSDKGNTRLKSESKVNDVKMPFFSHLEELRARIIKSLIAVILASGISIIFVKPIIRLLEKPAKSIHFLQLSPGEFLFSSIKVAGYSGLTIALPFILFQVLQFILPGLTKKEKQFIAPAVIGSALLFFLGISFALWVLIPAALKFLVTYGADVVEPLWSIERYLDFVFLLMLSSGLAFQLPVIQLILGTLGILQSQKMIANWRIVVMGSALAGAILTPSTDPLTMILLASSITALFLIGVGMVAITEKIKEQTPSIVHPPSTSN
tara:strand:+ start:8113 stop:8925 length:813 start_codon:yes stop_codon:yes gene_type:complete